MVKVEEDCHPRSLHFRTARRVFIMRTVQKMKWKVIQGKVFCRDKKTRPSLTNLRDHVREFQIGKEQRVYKYKNCGRKPRKLSRALELWIVSRLVALRKDIICTATTLQQEVAQKKGVTLNTGTIRKILKKHGYKWEPRSQKPQYSKEEKDVRLGFADEILTMTTQELQRDIAMSMDGVVLTLAPTDATQRENYCKVGFTHVYRKKDEAAKPELSGGNGYATQVPYARQCPMWGGIGVAGFGLVMFHKFRKVDSIEWVDSVESGEVRAACMEASGRSRGPWKILCDNESFLHTVAAQRAHAKARIELWHVPPRSPDLNPVELFWAKVRQWLRMMDLNDLRLKRPPVQKSILKERVKRLLKTRRARVTAKNIFSTLRKKALAVRKAKGGAIRG